MKHINCNFGYIVLVCTKSLNGLLRQCGMWGASKKQSQLAAHSEFLVHLNEIQLHLLIFQDGKKLKPKHTCLVCKKVMSAQNFSCSFVSTLTCIHAFCWVCYECEFFQVYEMKSSKLLVSNNIENKLRWVIFYLYLLSHSQRVILNVYNSETG